jgi:hypothetical protein
MQPERFETSQWFDQFIGRSGMWRRQVALVKDGEPTGANFVVLLDRIDGKRPAVWRLWLNAARLERHDWGVRLIGKEDVDIDVVFWGGAPAGLEFETKSLRSLSSLKGPVETTQTAIVVPITPDRDQSRPVPALEV